MSYTADDIKSLTFKEGVRTRIQMYLGSADNEGAYQAFKEIINNATDEAICGYGKKIDIEVNEKENSIEIRDYGRGVPFLVKEDGTNVLVNLANIKDKKIADDYETTFSSLAIINLLKNPMEIVSTTDIFKIHKILFKEIYIWAGKPRTINIYKNEPVLGGLSVNYSDYQSIDN